VQVLACSAARYHVTAEALAPHVVALQYRGAEVDHAPVFHVSV
jgi:hypothetical protein